MKMKVHYFNRDFEEGGRESYCSAVEPCSNRADMFTSVRLIRVSVLSGFSGKKKNVTDTCFIDLNTKQGHPTTVSSFILLHEKFLHLIGLEQWYFRLI